MRRYILWMVGLALVILASDLVAGGAAAGALEAERLDGMDDVAEVLAQAAPATPTLPGAVPGLRRRLNLTDEQARRVELVLTAFRTRTERLRIDLARARLDVREALLTTTPDRARLEGLARRIGELQGQLLQARFDMLVELKGILTPEQWARFRTMRARRWALGRRR